MSGEAQFSGKTIAITGAASGIGLATAHLLAARGANVSLADLQHDGLVKVQDQIQAQYPTAEILIFPLDVRQYDQVESWTTETVKRFGRLDGAANLAGIVPKSVGVGTIENQDFGEWDFAMGVNLTGVMHCLRAQLRAMQESGAIVNASSIAGLQGRSKNGAYAASKHGVLGLTRSAAKEVGVKAIRVNAICPGRIDTPMMRMAANAATSDEEAARFSKETNMDVSLGRMGRPEEVAMLIAFLLSDQSTYISGQGISIDGGWNC